MYTYLEIISFKTKKVVKRFNVTHLNERMIDKMDDGLNINLNHIEYYTTKNTTKRKYNCV